MELVIALVLFVGLIVAWLFLPGTTTETTSPVTAHADVHADVSTTMHQPA